MKKKLKLFNVWCTTKFGTGVQTVKAETKRDARARFKKRFTKSRILSVDLIEEPTVRQQQHFIY